MTTTRPRVALDGHYSMTGAAAILAVDRKTVYRWRQLGYLKTKISRFTKQPYVEGREIVKVFDVFDWQKKAQPCAS